MTFSPLPHFPRFLEAADPVTSNQVYEAEDSDPDLGDIAHLMPGFDQELLFQFGQSPFGGADQIVNRMFMITHGFQGFFCRDAAIRDPGTVGCAVLFVQSF